MGLALKVGSSFSGGLGWVSWWFKVGLGVLWGQNVSLGPWALDSLGFVAYEEAGGLGGAQPPHLQKHGREEATSQKSKKPKSQKAKKAVMLGCYW